MTTETKEITEIKEITKGTEPTPLCRTYAYLEVLGAAPKAVPCRTAVPHPMGMVVRHGGMKAVPHSAAVPRQGTAPAVFS